MRTPIEIVADVVDCGRTNRADHLAAFLRELDRSLISFKFFPDEALGRLLLCLSDSAFLGSTGSWRLVHLLDNNWDLLSVEHRSRLRPLLIAVFDNHADFMWAFAVGEILGRRYCDEEALDSLVRLSETARMPARALVPHGIETLARGTDNPRLQELAIERLRSLSNSDIEEVRREALLSLDLVDAIGSDSLA
jgi:hypothetical protein